MIPHKLVMHHLGWTGFELLTSDKQYITYDRGYYFF